jgi:hypothetical protein
MRDGNGGRGRAWQVAIVNTSGSSGHTEFLSPAPDRSYVHGHGGGRMLDNKVMVVRMVGGTSVSRRIRPVRKTLTVT